LRYMNLLSEVFEYIVISLQNKKVVEISIKNYKHGEQRSNLLSYKLHLSSQLVHYNELQSQDTPCKASKTDDLPFTALELHLIDVQRPVLITYQFEKFLCK